MFNLQANYKKLSVNRLSHFNLKKKWAKCASTIKRSCLEVFFEGPKVAKIRKRTDGDNGKASNATQRSLKESLAAPGLKFTQAIYESKVCNKTRWEFASKLSERPTRS